MRNDYQSNVIGSYTVWSRCTFHWIQPCDNVGSPIDSLLVTYLQTILLEVLFCNCLLQNIKGDVDIRS